MPIYTLSRTLLFKKCLFYALGCSGSELQHANSSSWHVGSSSQTRDRAWVLCIASTEPQPLDHQGSPGQSYSWGLYILHSIWHSLHFEGTQTLSHKHYHQHSFWKNLSTIDSHLKKKSAREVSLP